jgi:hypothetical protein
MLGLKKIKNTGHTQSAFLNRALLEQAGHLLKMPVFFLKRQKLDRFANPVSILSKIHGFLRYFHTSFVDSLSLDIKLRICPHSVL